MRTFAQVQTGLWNHPTFRSRPKAQRDLMLYLMSSPHSNYIGYYHLPLSYITNDIQEPLADVQAALDALCVSGWCAYDPAAQVILIRDHLQYPPKINGNKQVLGAQAAAKAVPKSPLLTEWVKCACLHCPDYRDRWESLLSGAPSPSPAPSEANGAPSPEAQSAASAEEGKMDTPKPEPDRTPDGLQQLADCHEQHAGRLLSTDDYLKLRAVLSDAQEAGVEWQSLLTIMRQAQKDYKPSRTAPAVKGMGYYLQYWEPHIREAKAEGGRRTRASPYSNGAYDDGPPPDDEDDPLAARVRAQTAALLRAAGHGG